MLKKTTLGAIAALIILVTPELIAIDVSFDTTVTPLPTIGRCE